MKMFQYTGLISAAFLGGLVANLAFNNSSNVDAQDKEEKLTVVSANEFVLQDKDGKKRASLGFTKAGTPQLYLYAADGGAFEQLADIDAKAASAKKIATMNKDIKRLADVEEVEDKEVTVIHILISFAGTRTSATRTKEEAEALAADVFEKVKAGTDFETLKTDYSDDPGPGTYTMVTFQPAPEGKYYRKGMVPAFGNTGWKLAIGEVGVAGFDAVDSPYGWHIVKRLK